MSYAEDMKQYRALLKALEDRFTKPIYHYTGAEGFRGIVASSEIWMTNASFLNDTTECMAFWDCAEDLAADERLSNQHVKEKLGSRLEDRRKNCLRNDNYYVASFSTERNCLSQYRAYGAFCIGFDARKMSGERHNLYRCVYEKKDIIDWVCRKAQLRKWDVECLKEDSKRGAADDLVFAASVKHKHEAYRDECEVRMVAASGGSPGPVTKAMAPQTAQDSAKLICAREPPIDFRDRSTHGILTPYVKFFISGKKPRENTWKDMQKETVAQMRERKLKEEDEIPRELLPITEVWIGPMVDQEKTRLACEIMLREKGYENVPVIASDIPYRGI